MIVDGPATRSKRGAHSYHAGRRRHLRRVHCHGSATVEWALTGVMAPDSRRTDGTISEILRDYANRTIRLEESRSWVVCFPIWLTAAAWTEGVLSRLIQELNEPLPKAKEGKEMRWIIYDGDVDAVWVENMNSRQ